MSADQALLVLGSMSAGSTIASSFFSNAVLKQPLSTNLAAESFPLALGVMSYGLSSLIFPSYSAICAISVGSVASGLCLLPKIFEENERGYNRPDLPKIVAGISGAAAGYATLLGVTALSDQFQKHSAVEAQAKPVYVEQIPADQMPNLVKRLNEAGIKAEQTKDGKLQIIPQP